MLLLIALTSFITLVIVFYVVYRHVHGDREMIQDRVGKFVDRREQPAAPLPGAAQAKQLTGWRIVVRRMSKYFESPQWSRLIEHKLIQAGLPMRGSEFLVICLGAGLIGALFLFVLSGGKLIAGLIGGMGGYFAPLLVLRMKIERRVRAFNSQLGDALILVANSLRTGYSFMQSIEMVSREMPKPIGEEFARVLKEMNLGVTTEEAMNNLAKRINSDDLDLVVTAVLIQRQVGGNLAEVLNNISNTIRERVKIKGQIKTLTAQGRISGVIVSILPIAIGGIIYIINPGYIQMLFTHPMGKAMIGAGIASQLVGIMFIRKIVNIEV